MTEIDRIAYAVVQAKLQRLEQRITEWERQEWVVRSILHLLQKQYAEEVSKEKALQVKYGISVSNTVAP